MKKLYGLVGLAMLGFCPLLFAGSPYQEVGNGWHGIAGVGTFVRTEPYKQVGHKILPIPYLIMRRGNFFIEGLEAGYRAIEGANGSFNFIITPRLEGFDADDGAILNGMENRDFSIDGGIATVWRQDTIEFNLLAVVDLLDKSDGKEVAVSLGNNYILTGKMIILTPSIGLKWQDDQLVNYYYGVNPTEAKANRPAYIGKATLNYTAAMNATYSLSKRSTLFAEIEYEHFGDDIHDSPLVGEEQMINIFLGYGWQF